MPEPSCPPGGTMVSSFLQSGAVHQDGSGTGQRPKTVFGRLAVRTGPGPGQVVKSGSWRCIGFRFPDIGLIDIPASFDLALVHVFRQGHVILLLSVVGKRGCRCPKQFASLSFSPNDTTFESLRPIRFGDRSTRARRTCLKKRIFLTARSEELFFGIWRKSRLVSNWFSVILSRPRMSVVRGANTGIRSADAFFSSSFSDGKVGSGLPEWGGRRSARSGQGKDGEGRDRGISGD